jgi:hypothetical protein
LWELTNFYKLHKIVVTVKCVYFTFLIYIYIYLLVIIYFPNFSYKIVKIVYYSWMILLRVFVCDGSVYGSINTSQHNEVDLIKVFLRMFAVVRKTVKQGNKSNFKTSWNIECMLADNISYRFKSINILLHIGLWLYS